MIIILAILLGILLFASRRACAFERPDPEQWTSIIETDNGTGYYADLKTAKFSKESDGHHVVFFDQMTNIEDGKLEFRLITRRNVNLNKKTFRDLGYTELDENGKVVECVDYTSEEFSSIPFVDKKFQPIEPGDPLEHIYDIVLLHFLRFEGRPSDRDSAFENPDPAQWIPLPVRDESRCYVDVKNAVFPTEPDGTHAIFWSLRREMFPGEATPKYILYNIEMNLIHRTDRLLDYMVLDEEGKIVETGNVPPYKYEPTSFGYGSDLWEMYEVILGRYAAEKVIPSEGAIVFRKPNPEQWTFIAEFDDGVSIYVDLKSAVFFKAPNGLHTLFWYQSVPTDPKNPKKRQLARYSMNLTKKTIALRDSVDFDDNGAVNVCYSIPPKEVKVSRIEPETIIWVIYEYLLDRSKSAEMIEMKPQEPKKATGAKKPKKSKQKKTYGKTKRSRRK